MISHLRGIVLDKGADHAVIEVGGVGYKVFASPDTLAGMTTGDEVACWTYLAVREHAHDLYGFTSRDELRFFELLVGVSGIGPKSALAVLGIASVETLRSAIADGNPSYLTKVAGVGKKTAEKIVLELQEKVGIATDGAGGVLRSDEGAFEALRSMGYSASEARDALRGVDKNVTDEGARLREAIKSLGSRA